MIIYVNQDHFKRNLVHEYGKINKMLMKSFFLNFLLVNIKIISYNLSKFILKLPVRFYYIIVKLFNSNFEFIISWSGAKKETIYFDINYVNLGDSFQA